MERDFSVSTARQARDGDCDQFHLLTGKYAHSESSHAFFKASVSKNYHANVVRFVYVLVHVKYTL